VFRSYGPVHGFMVWNTFLALVPTAIALVLFRRRASVGPAWWALFAGWLLMLPNAPYVLTDVLHLVDDMHHASSWLDGYTILAVYAAFFGVGVLSYVVSLQLFRNFLHRVAPRRLVAPALLALHGLCVVAMYVGRVFRFNSWDAVLAPGVVAEQVLRVPRPQTILILAVMFAGAGAAALVTKVVCDAALAHLRRLG
jgi:uncharacterized membrane protein